MAHKLFIAATGQNSGKTTTSLSLLHLARQRYGRVGFIKPLGPKPMVHNGEVADKDAVLMAQILDQEHLLPLMSPVVLLPGDTRKAVEGVIDVRQMEQKIIEACAELEKQCDFLIIEGAGHTGVGSVLKLSNARIAKMLEAPVLMVTGGGIGNAVDRVSLNMALFQREQVDVRAVLINKIHPNKRTKVLRTLEKAFADEPFEVLGGFNYQPILANPTLRRLSRILDLPIMGESGDGACIVHQIQIGAASTQRVTELLGESSLVIVTSSRDELLVTLTVLYKLPEYRSKIAGLLIPGTQPVGKITQQILDNSGIPYMRAPTMTTAQIYQKVTADVSKITAEDTEKIALIEQLAEKRLDMEQLVRVFGFSE